jgi:hypothetical protein
VSSATAYVYTQRNYPDEIRPRADTAGVWWYCPVRRASPDCDRAPPLYIHGPSIGEENTVQVGIIIVIRRINPPLGPHRARYTALPRGHPLCCSPASLACLPALGKGLLGTMGCVSVCGASARITTVASNRKCRGPVPRDDDLVPVWHRHRRLVSIAPRFIRCHYSMIFG